MRKLKKIYLKKKKYERRRTKMYKIKKRRGTLGRRRDAGIDSRAIVVITCEY